MQLILLKRIWDNIRHCLYAYLRNEKSDLDSFIRKSEIINYIIFKIEKLNASKKCDIETNQLIQQFRIIFRYTKY